MACGEPAQDWVDFLGDYSFRCTACPPIVSEPMDAGSSSPGGGAPDDTGSEQRLLDGALEGSVSAIDGLFARYAPWLRRRGAGPAPGVGSRRDRHERHRAGRPAAHLQAPRVVRIEARGRHAGVSPACGGEPDPGRIAPRDPTSGHQALPRFGGGLCGPSRTGLRSTASCGTRRPGSVTGRVSRHSTIETGG